MSRLNELMAQFFKAVHMWIETIIGSGSYTYGITIIVFVIIIRIILLPLNYKQMKSQLKMTEIQPEMKKIQDKHKKDPQKANEEVMKLYKESGANPLGGCLPMLIQWPILLALFVLFQKLGTQPAPDGIKGVSFLWVKDLSASKELVLAVLSGATTYLSSMLMMQGGDPEQAKKSSTMNIGMSAFMIYMGYTFNAAIVLYYTVSNIFQIGQTILIKKLVANSKAKKLDTPK